MEKILKGSISTIRHAPKKAAKKTPRGTTLWKSVYKQGLQLFSKQLSLLWSLFIVSLENREHNGNWTPFTALWRKFRNSRPPSLGLQVHWWYLDRCVCLFYLFSILIFLFLMGSRTLTTKTWMLRCQPMPYLAQDSDINENICIKCSSSRPDLKHQ